MRFQLKTPDQTFGSKRAAAFSLVEVMVAAVIAAIVLAAVFGGISKIFNLLTSTREDLRATQIIVSRLEALRLEAWGNGTNQPTQLFNTTNVPNFFTDYFYPLGLASTTNQGMAYSGSVTIATNLTFSSYSGAMALVTIRVNWTDSNYGITNQHTRAMSTYVSQNGIQNYIYTH